MGRPRRTVLEYRNYELPADFPILALTGDHWHISSVPGKRLHIHNCLEIGVCHSAGGTMVFNRRQVHFSAGDVTCIARNVPHTTWSDPDAPSRWSYLFLDPDALLGPGALRQIRGLRDVGFFLSDCSLLLHEEQAPWAKRYAEDIISELTDRQPGYQPRVQGLVAALLVGMLRIYSQEETETLRDSDMSSVAPALDYIHENYMINFPQERLSQLCHLSPTHFRRVFKEEIGISSLEFLHQTRILNSCTLLRSSNLSITEVAWRVGYNSLSSFNRQFSRAMGCSPTAWRKTAADGPPPSLMTFTGWMTAEPGPDRS